jgi:hypothetical protein
MQASGAWILHPIIGHILLLQAVNLELTVDDADCLQRWLEIDEHLCEHVCYSFPAL